MADVTGTAQTDGTPAQGSSLVQALREMFASKNGSIAGQTPRNIQAQGDIIHPEAEQGAPSGGFMEALQNLFSLFGKKPGSASNDAKYQKALTDAGLPAEETGIESGAH